MSSVQQSQYTQHIRIDQTINQSINSTPSVCKINASRPKSKNYSKNDNLPKNSVNLAVNQEIVINNAINPQAAVSTKQKQSNQFEKWN